MVTRRDTKLTDEQTVLFNQMRGLFRHVPFTQRDFANLAPNVAATLSPENPENALPVLWDILDRQERDKHLDALLVLLGMTRRDGNVLDRKMALNHDVHPRTIARWADTALTGIIRTISNEYVVQKAEAYVRATEENGSLRLFLTFGWVGVMDAPSVNIGDELIELPDDDSHFLTLRRLVPSGTEVYVAWHGLLRPTFQLEAVVPSLTFNTSANECWLWWPEARKLAPWRQLRPSEA